MNPKHLLPIMPSLFDIADTFSKQTFGSKHQKATCCKGDKYHTHRKKKRAAQKAARKKNRSSK